MSILRSHFHTYPECGVVQVLWIERFRLSILKMPRASLQVSRVILSASYSHFSLRPITIHLLQHSEGEFATDDEIYTSAFTILSFWRPLTWPLGLFMGGIGAAKAATITVLFFGSVFLGLVSSLVVAMVLRLTRLRRLPLCRFRKECAKPRCISLLAQHDNIATSTVLTFHLAHLPTIK
jgi:hypothetical protein